MADGRISVSQDQFTCSVCLEILKDPVSIPCGHSFCIECISKCWDQSGVYSCPHCREIFSSKPVLRKNIIVAEIVDGIKRRRLNSPKEMCTRPGDVECDFCTEGKFKAVKSCLTCVASFCEIHIQPHKEVTSWKTHKLVDPAGNLLENLCIRHKKCLEIFCRTDQACICCLCAATGHRGHETVEPEKERFGKQKQLEVTMKELQQRIQERQKKVEDLKLAINFVKTCAGREIQESQKSFIDLINVIEETRKKVTELIKDKENREVEKVEALVLRLEKEIDDLMRTDNEMTELSNTDDHIHFLQTFPSLCVPAGDGDTPCISAHTGFSFEDLRRELFCLKERLEDISNWMILSVT
ncbi:E3 ubiquitin/ISG15 ligase TRIM25-like [Polypterus senegalus]|uniref:E3 ubiquitin/ISG15 ligase TRIM25-like n=1 Tax=Polypterus senegalus TaxID=55291 RepID=UPI001964A992|nr:E3 ubiquitin/ISG15 ligase TRIM25-like [Polypterus senegalus]